ncbi:MAG: guanylate kinase [Planctomycetes bacterium]|nr:guanylate kinase [Planctomycetota bacterium]
MSNYFIVLSGPSGSGKTTVISKLLQTDLPKLKRLVTCTTRDKRSGEINGRDYFFWTKERFQQAIQNKELLEYEFIYGNHYGSPSSELIKLLDSGLNVIASLGIGGAMRVKELKIPSVMIFLKVSSPEELRKRLKQRSPSASDVEIRLNKARDELASENRFDYSVPNDNLDDCVKTIYEFLKDKLC